MGTFNCSAKYLSKKDSSTMLPELTECVPATRMGIARKVLLGLENRARCIFFTSSQCFWMALTLQNLKLGGNLEFSWQSCNILRYCSNRCIIWSFIPENCSAQANRKIPVQLYAKIQILFEPSFWICKSPIISGYGLRPIWVSVF